MKFAYIIENVAGTGGMERNISTKANYLAENYGYDLTIITIYQKGRPYTYELSPLVKTIDLNVNFAGKSSFTIKKEINLKLEKILCEEHFDICVSWGCLDVYSLYKINDGSKKVLEYHFDYSTFAMRAKSIKDRLMAFFRRKLFIHAAKHYDKFVLLTKQDEAVWKRYCKNTIHIYNPLFINKKEYPPKAIDSKIICAIGRLDYQKGYDLLISAWHKVVELHPDWKLNIYGEGADRNTLQQLIDLHHLQGKIELCGYCTDVGHVLNQSDLFVFPSRFEGFGNVLLEAMAYGVPPISFDCPCGPKEIIENNKNGVLVPHLDINAFVEKVNELIDNIDQRTIMSKNAIKRSEEFSIQSIMKIWDSMFNELLQ